MAATATPDPLVHYVKQPKSRHLRAVRPRTPLLVVLARALKPLALFALDALIRARDLLVQLIGFVLVAVGCGMYSKPLGLIVGGVLMLYFHYLLTAGDVAPEESVE